jgi:hypothetical protein
MFAENIRWILILTGALAAGAAIVAAAPKAALGFLFGESPSSAVDLLFVRHWGVAVAGVGVLLVWSAFNPSLREPVLIFAAVEKMAFASGDFLIAILYLVYLFGKS